MAEINIRRKKKPIWPWLLALLVVLGILWILTVTTDTDSPEDPVEENMETPENNTSMDTVPGEPANTFARFVKEHTPPAGDSLPAEYIIEGMDHLSATLGTLVDKKFIDNPEVSEKRSALTSKIDQLKADSASERLPDHVKEVCTSAADLMVYLQEESYPELDGTVSDIKKVAASIETAPDEPTLKKEVTRFFEESSHATVEMTGSANQSL